MKHGLTLVHPASWLVSENGHVFEFILCLCLSTLFCLSMCPKATCCLHIILCSCQYRQLTHETCFLSPPLAMRGSKSLWPRFVARQVSCESRRCKCKAGYCNHRGACVSQHQNDRSRSRWRSDGLRVWWSPVTFSGDWDSPH